MSHFEPAAAKAYRALEHMIVTLELAPASFVTEGALIERLGLGRTPVREAFNRLERDGLVIGRPRQGYVVAEFNLTMFREAFDIRELLDGRATELAAATATAADKTRLR
ncbi:MAG: GntR family transcriptional regulator, partial [Mesorhizobium sp.]